MDLLPTPFLTIQKMSLDNAFTIPRLISDEMCEFMGIPLNSKCSQTSVTKFLCDYIKINKCYDPDKHHCINPDSKLRKLLGTEFDEEVLYVNLQSLLKKHYINTNANTELDLGDDRPSDELIEDFGEYYYEKLEKNSYDPELQDYKKISELTDPELIDIRNKLNKLISKSKICIMNQSQGTAFIADLAIGYEGDKILICGDWE